MTSNPTKTYREIIKNQHNSYYIVNENSSTEYMSVLIAVKLEKAQDSTSLKVKEQKFLVFAFDKDQIINSIFKAHELPEKTISKIFENLTLDIQSRQTLNNESIITINDVISSDTTIYVITEYCDYNFNDYIQDLIHESYWSSEEMEVELRAHITKILWCITETHSNNFHFWGWIDIQNIYWISKEKNKKIKLLHPCLSSLITLIKIYSDNISNYSYFAPEMFEIFKDRTKVQEAIWLNNSIEGIKTSLKKFEKYEFDFWSFGFLMYQIIFHQMPFRIDSVDRYDMVLKMEKTYEVETSYLTNNYLDIMASCMLFDLKIRFNDKIPKYNDMLNEFYKMKNDDVEAEIKKKQVKKEPKLFFFVEKNKNKKGQV